MYVQGAIKLMSKFKLDEDAMWSNGKLDDDTL